MPIIFFLFLTWLKIYNWIDLFLDLRFAVDVAFYIEIHFKYIKTSITSPSIKTMSFLLLFMKRGLDVYKYVFTCPASANESSSRS